MESIVAGLVFTSAAAFLGLFLRRESRMNALLCELRRAREMPLIWKYEHERSLMFELPSIQGLTRLTAFRKYQHLPEVCELRRQLAATRDKEAGVKVPFYLAYVLDYEQFIAEDRRRRRAMLLRGIRLPSSRAFRRVVDLFGELLPPSIRQAAYIPSAEDLKAEYVRARSRYRTPWARRWIGFSFLVRTLVLWTQTLAVWAHSPLSECVAAIARIVVGVIHSFRSPRDGDLGPFS